MQLPLGISLKTSTTLENFVPGENSQILADLAACIEGNGAEFLYLWGGEGTGKSHLLQGACRLAGDQGIAVAYIPLEQAEELDPGIFSDLERMALVCLDNIQMIAAQPAWEEAMFHLFNRLQEQGSRLLITADQSPGRLPLLLPDLASRLSWGVCYQIHPLDDQAKQRALIDGAAQRGMELSLESARYILRHAPRDMGSLLAFLDTLDQAALAAQRRPTIPFIRTLL